MRNRTATLLTLAMILALCLFGCGGQRVKGGPNPDGSPSVGSAGQFSGGSGTEADPYMIMTASDLAAVSENLSASYRLGADIDLSGAEWTPIGTYREAEKGTGVPVKANAFTGTFDGGSHTISNLRVDQPGGQSLGLFGCLRDAHIYNLSLDTVTLDGNRLLGAVAGYACNSRLTAVSLTGSNFLTGHHTEAGNAERIGGMVGGAKDSLIDSCAARANILLPDTASRAGILCGSLDTSSVLNGYATGTLTAASGCFGLGAVAGSVTGSGEVTNCTAEYVSIAAGDSASLLGGIAGCVERREGEAERVTFTRCTAVQTELSTGEGGTSVGGIVGGERFPEGQDGSDDTPAAFILKDCTSEANANGTSAPFIGTEREDDTGPERGDEREDDTGPDKGDETPQEDSAASSAGQ